MNWIDLFYRAGCIMAFLLIVDIAMDGKIDLPVLHLHIKYRKAWKRLKGWLKWH